MPPYLSSRRKLGSLQNTLRLATKTIWISQFNNDHLTFFPPTTTPPMAKNKRSMSVEITLKNFYSTPGRSYLSCHFNCCSGLNEIGISLDGCFTCGTKLAQTHLRFISGHCDASSTSALGGRSKRGVDHEHEHKDQKEKCYFHLLVER